MGSIQTVEYDLPPAIVSFDRFCSGHRFKATHEFRSAVAARRAMPNLGGEGKDLPGDCRYIEPKFGEREDALGYRTPQASLHKLDSCRRHRGGDRGDPGGGAER